jgi:single-strand DNA-binding protein
MNLNSVILSGHLTSDPAAAGRAAEVATFSLSFLAPFGTDRAGGARRRDFVSVVAFGKSAEACLSHLKEGSKVVVDGRLRQDRWGSPASGEHSRVTIVADRVHFVSGLRKTVRSVDPPPGQAPPEAGTAASPAGSGTSASPGAIANGS